MGYMRHHAFVVTGSSGQETTTEEAHAEALRLDLNPTNIVACRVNGYCSFLIPPDGSKEGWEESDEGNAKRWAFFNWLVAHCYEDGSSPFQWAEIQYGDEEHDNRIVACSGRMGDSAARPAPAKEPT